MRHKLVETNNPKKVPKILREKSKEVKEITPQVLDLAKQMAKIMEKNNGIGISAVQIGVPVRLILVRDCKDDYFLVNPKIKSFSRKEVVYNEGCLSFPGLFKEISRPEKIKVVAQLLDGRAVEIDAEGLVARTLEHEIDHLDGVLFIDHAGK